MVVAVACQTNRIKKCGTIHLKKRKETEVYSLGGGVVEGLWVSKKSKNDNIKKQNFLTYIYNILLPSDCKRFPFYVLV